MCMIYIFPTATSKLDYVAIVTELGGLFRVTVPCRRSSDLSVLVLRRIDGKKQKEKKRTRGEMIGDRKKCM